MNLQDKINDPNATLVDVRESFEFWMGSIEGAINIPLGKVPTQIDAFKYMQKPIIVFCRSGNRSEQARSFLAAHGVTEVYNGGGLGEMRAYRSEAA